MTINPYFQVSEKCLSHMTKLASILGIGVRSRIGIDIQQKKKESIFDISKVAKLKKKSAGGFIWRYKDE